MQNIAQLLTMLLKYPPTDAHINITMKLMNKMYILWNSIMCQQISLSDCKNEKSLSKDRAQSRNDAETSEAYPKACVPVHSYTNSNNNTAKWDDSQELLSHCDNKRTAFLDHFKNEHQTRNIQI